MIAEKSQFDAQQIRPVNQSLHFVPVALGRPSLITITGAFSEADISRIEERCAELPLEHKLIGPEGDIKHNQLDVRVGALSNTPETSWLFIKLEQLLQAANVALRVSVWGISEELQYTVYTEGRYCWHVDNATPLDGLARPPRKLSFELMLSAPEEYEGGTREHMGKTKTSAKNARGTLIVFPSYVLTRVYSVTSGARRSVEGWVCGEEFR